LPRAQQLFQDAYDLFNALGIQVGAERIRENWLPGAV
jgi:hypothetical protein